MKTKHVLIYGRVQRVCFRFFTLRNARQLGITGFVQNLPDGSVELVAQGDENNLDILIDRCQKGSMFSKVTDLKVENMETNVIFGEFKVRNSYLQIL